jgi:neutral trehalase
MDNAPSWDAPLRFVPSATNPHLARRDVATVAAAHRPTDADYERYLGIVAALRGAGWDTVLQVEVSPFAVEDVAFTAIAARAAADLAAVAADVREDGAGLLRFADGARAAITRLWDDEAGWFRSYDVKRGGSLGPLTATGLVALFAGDVEPSRVDRMLARVDAWSDQVACMVVTCDPSAHEFEAARYWRGPVWVLVNWLVAEGLALAGRGDRAESLRRSTLALVEREGFSEYYDAVTGAGIGGQSFSWSAALTLAWLDAEGRGLA